jgi:ribonuclease I
MGCIHSNYFQTKRALTEELKASILILRQLADRHLKSFTDFQKSLTSKNGKNVYIMYQ